MHTQTVGLKGLKTPVRVKEKTGKLQNTIATISMRARLSENNRDNCVDTFTSVMGEYLGELSVASFPIDFKTPTKRSAGQKCSAGNDFSLFHR